MVSTATRRRIYGSLIGFPLILAGLGWLPHLTAILLAVMAAAETQTAATWTWTAVPGEEQRTPSLKYLALAVVFRPLTAITVLGAIGFTLLGTLPNQLVINWLTAVACFVLWYTPRQWRLFESVACLTWVGIGSSSLLALRLGPHGFLTLLAVMLVSFSSDIGGYVAGKTWGKSPVEGRLSRWMARRIGGWFYPRRTDWVKPFPLTSPNKTWVGTLAWLITPLVVGGLATLIMIIIMVITGGSSYWVQRLLVITLATTIASPIGDLSASVVKRLLKIKDFSTAGFGHGGWMDRLDAIFASTFLNCLVLMII